MVGQSASFENREGSKFGDECRQKLELTCPECKIKIRVDSKFSDECGSDLTTLQEAPYYRQFKTIILHA